MVSRSSCIFCFGLLLLLAGCTKPPPIPELSSREPLPVERLALSDRIRGNDLRQIMGAINENNRLAAIAQLVDSASEGELDTVADLLSDYLYLDVGITNALPDLIQQRMQQSGFSSWQKATSHWKASGRIVPVAKFLKYLATLPEFRRCVEQDGALLSPRLAQTFNRLRQQSKVSFHPQFPFEKGSTSPELLLNDIEKLLQSDVAKEFEALADDWNTKGLGTPFFRALGYLRERFPNSSAFEGLARNLSRMLVTRNENDPILREKNQLELLFDLGAVLDEGSVPLLRKLHDEQLVPTMTQAFREFATRAYGGWIRTALQKPEFNFAFWKDFVRKNPQDPPRPNFRKVFHVVLEQMEWLNGPPRAENTPQTISANEYIYLNAFAMTKWLETTLQKNSPLKEGDLWTTPLKMEREQIDFIQQGKTALIFPQEADLAALGLGSFSRQMGISFDHRLNFKGYQFPIELDSATDTLSKALPAVAKELDSVRNYGNQRDAVSALGNLMARSGGGATPLNLMDSLNWVAGFLPHDLLHDIRTAVILDSGIADLSSDDVELKLAPFSDKETVFNILKRIFFSLPALAAFDDGVGNLPSAFVAYQELADKFRAEPHALTRVLTLLHHAQIATAKESADPNFPGFYALIKHGEDVARLVFSLSLPTTAERSLILQTLESLFGPTENDSTGLQLHLDLLRRALREQKALLLQVWKALEEEGLDWVFDLNTWTSPERQFTQRFLREGGMTRLWDFLQGHSESTKLLEVVKDLKRLYDSGDLERTCHLLEFVHDTRLKRTSALFLTWIRTGELKSFLNVLETWLEAAK